VGGLALFLYLAPRRREPRQPAFADTGPGEPGTASLPPPRPAAAADVVSDLPPEEAKLPRWLRPSVQAARHDDERGSPGTRRLGDS